MSANKTKYPKLTTTPDPVTVTQTPTAGNESTKNAESKRLLIDYFVYPIYGLIIFTPAFAEIYSNYYKLTRLNGSFSDFDWSKMSTDLIYALLFINLIFAAYMVIRKNMTTISKEWKAKKNTIKLFETFLQTAWDTIFLFGIFRDLFGNNPETNQRLKALGRLLVVESAAFYVSSIILSSYNDLITNWEFNHSTAMTLAAFCGIGALIGGMSFSKSKVEETLPCLKKILVNKSKKRKWLFGLIIINFAGAGFSFKFSQDAFSSIASLSNNLFAYNFLAVINTFLLTIVMLLISIHALYKPEIAGNGFENKAEKEQPFEKAKKRWKENTKVGKFFFIIFSLISFVNLLTAAASSGFGWENTLSSALHGLPSELVKGLCMVAFFIATFFVGFGRFYFAHVVENTIKMDEDRDKITEGIKTVSKKLNPYFFLETTELINYSNTDAQIINEAQIQIIAK